MQRRAAKLRQQAATGVNSTSSRSHCVFTVGACARVDAAAPGTRALIRQYSLIPAQIKLVDACWLTHVFHPHHSQLQIKLVDGPGLQQAPAPGPAVGAKRPAAALKVEL